jgi:hypothetical protein
MHLMPPTTETRNSELETIALSGKHLDYLGQLSLELNPNMPLALGWPHLIRKILDRFEESGIDLTDASSEEEIARLAAGRLRGKTTRGRTPRSNGRVSASSMSRQAVRPAYQSNLPARGRSRSGKPPRSSHG